MTIRGPVELRPGYHISPVIRGAWQLAGGHGVVDRNEAVRNLEAAYKAGITTFDCADIYTGVEDLLGELRKKLLNGAGVRALAQLKIHTKFVPDLDLLPTIRKADVLSTIERSLRRLRTERLDLVQYHWWDYDVPGCMEVALWLKDLQQDGKIDLIGGTNFDTLHTARIMDAGVPLAGMQVQYSLIDARPEHGLIELCRKHNVHLLCYGTIAGGFLSDAWLNKSEPQPPFENRSLTKYKLIIDDFGGWDLFQDLLRALRNIADRHAVDIATVASRAVLARPQVAAVIIGARNLGHLPENIAIMNLQLTAREIAEIDAVLSRRLGPKGDVFTLERDRFGRHGSIMKYNLGRQAS
jgi:aryl-alcohol dehydrogenase-like predicted oxidoreductase